MAKAAPTESELVILDVLWEDGPSAVRAIHERLGRSIGYTGVLKLLQIMHAKGLVARDESERAHVYSAVDRREEVESRLVSDLAHKAFGGSPVRLALRALAEKPATAEELTEIRALLDRLKSGKRGEKR